jgi:diacylglycerol kinase (ATP)
MKSTPFSFVRSVGYATKGLLKAFRTERHMKIHVVIMLCVILFGVYIKLSMMEWSVICLCFAMVIGAELFNTAIEKLVDLVAPGYNEQAGMVKDIAAGAVLICVLVAVVVGGIIFIPKLCLW